jgi:hypothetical protein
LRLAPENERAFVPAEAAALSAGEHEAEEQWG